jgi:hypothetical protein
MSERRGAALVGNDPSTAAKAKEALPRRGGDTAKGEGRQVIRDAAGNSVDLQNSHETAEYVENAHEEGQRIRARTADFGQ